MENEQKAYMELRSGTRGLLDKIGVPTNPAVGDDWIVNELRRKALLKPIEYEVGPEEDFTLFQNSLIQILTERGTQVPEQDRRVPVLEARRLVHLLYSILSKDSK